MREADWNLSSRSYLALRKPEEAAAVLARRVDTHALRVALHVCYVAKEERAFRLYATRFVQECLRSADWAAATEVLSEHKSLQVSVVLDKI